MHAKNPARRAVELTVEDDVLAWNAVDVDTLHRLITNDDHLKR